MSTQTPTRTADPVIVLQQVSWQVYSALREEDRNRHVRMTYDQGTLYLMSPSRLHERIGELLARMVHAWTETREIAILSGGSTTMKSELIERGLEPDKCFYIQNEAVARQSDAYDADKDAPPDLAIEVDVTSLSNIRLPIYAKFGVPEVWRWCEDELLIYRLNDGGYEVTSESARLEKFPINVAVEFLDKRHELNETQLLNEFRQRIAGHAPWDGNLDLD